MPDTAITPPQFDDAFRDGFEELLRWRRDVRRFRSDAIADETRLGAVRRQQPAVAFC
jgi:5,6-dimethylbenzimidazole synthase